MNFDFEKLSSEQNFETFFENLSSEQGAFGGGGAANGGGEGVEGEYVEVEPDQEENKFK